jgi:SOS response regulatory protein OraA/RecX
MNEKQLRRKLEERDLDEQEIEEILDTFADLLLLDEAHVTLTKDDNED